MSYRQTHEVARKRKQGLQECPACHTTVLPTPERLCPACQGNVDACLSDGLRSITVRDDADLPRVCVRCGVATRHSTRCEFSRTDEQAGGQSTWLRVVLAILFPRSLRFTRAKKVDRMQLVIPHCHGCEHPAPEHVDFEQRELTLLVHRNLYAAMRSGVE